MTKKHRGSCYCGTVKYEADLDLSAGTYRCNCTYCTKTRNWVAPTAEPNHRITDGADRVSTFHGHLGNHFEFCTACGTRLWTRGEHPEYGRFVNVFVPTLDDVAPDDLAKVPVIWIDGLNDNFEATPQKTAHL